MKLAVVGTRTFNNYSLLQNELNKYDNITEIISGGATGADKLAEKYALNKNIKMTIFYPDWKKYGKKAGPLRNQQIINECDEAIAFWDGVSKGTLSSINLAKQANKNVKIIQS